MPKGQYKRTSYHLQRIRNGVKKRKKLYGENNPAWRGGRALHGDGYMRIRMIDHPNNVDGYILEHRLVMEKHLGRYLNSEEIVHHKNGDRLENRIVNLMLLTNKTHFIKGHSFKKENNPQWRGGKPKCSTCNKEISYNAKTCKKHRLLKQDKNGRFIWPMD